MGFLEHVLTTNQPRVYVLCVNDQPAEQQAASQDAELQIAVAQERLEMFYKKNVFFSHHA